MNIETTLTFSNETYLNVLRSLRQISNKSNIQTLKITDSVIGHLVTSTFNGFQNIINLDLNRCNIFEFGQKVFDSLIHLNAINLSNNNIVSIENTLFKSNHKLRTIILENNLLYEIASIVFSRLENLQILNLSYNATLVLEHDFLKCTKLKELHLNNCHIENIFTSAFHQLFNITYLALNNNKIEKINENDFQYLKNLKQLNLSHNLIQKIHIKAFHSLVNLSVLDLGTNCLKTVIDISLFHHNTNLIQLDLSHNDIPQILRGVFKNCRKLKILKLAVSDTFECSSITDLKHLETFELLCKKDVFTMTNHFWCHFKNKSFLTVLKLIFQKIENIRLCEFSHMKNLECLHIECLEPIHSERRMWNLYKIFPDMPPIKKLILKKLNSFKVANISQKSNSLKHLSLSGVKNKYFFSLFSCFVSLEYLDLSFSELEDLNVITFKHLVSLKHLDLSHSKLKFIKSVVFKNNYNLVILNCSHCLIEIIEDDSFANLSNLELLDLRGNSLLAISQNIFSGLNEIACVIQV